MRAFAACTASLFNPCPSASKSPTGIQNFQTMKIAIFFLTVFLPLTFGFSMPEEKKLTNCPDPANVTVVSKTSSSISFEWDDCECVPTEYRVYYVTGGYTSSEYATTSSQYTFTGLSAGEYSFYFYTVCGTEVSGFIVVTDTIEV